MLVPSSRYPGQTATDANYPQGKARNVSVSGDGTGTPWEKDAVNDWWGFQQALALDSGVTPSGSPDSAANSELLSALKVLIQKRSYASYVITPSVATANNVAFALTLSSQVGGYSLVGGNSVQAPSVGTYRVSFSACVQASPATNPQAVPITVRKATVAQMFASTLRFSANPAEFVNVSAVGTVTVFNPGTELIDIVSGATNLTLVPGGGSSFLILERLA